MRYALHAWCDKEYLSQADEIIVFYKEKERILDYPDLYPNKAITIQCYGCNSEDIDWKWLKEMSNMFPKNGFSIGVILYEDINVALQWGLKAYLLKHINNFMELNYLLQFNPCYIYVDQPLFSSIDQLKKFGIPVRWTPTLLDSSPGFLTNLLHGTWIRPEDIQAYDQAFPGCICDFVGTNGHLAEQAFWKIYHNEQQWNQDLGFLFLELKGKNIANYLIDPELVNQRLNCRQHCEEIPNGNGCHACDNICYLSNYQRVKDYLDNPKESLED